MGNAKHACTLLLQCINTFQFVTSWFSKHLAGWPVRFPWGRYWDSENLHVLNSTWSSRAQCCVWLCLWAQMENTGCRTWGEFEPPQSSGTLLSQCQAWNLCQCDLNRGPDTSASLCLDKHISLAITEVIAQIPCLVTHLYSILTQFSSESTEGTTLIFQK